MRSGDLVVWRSEMPHCNYPNFSNRLRLTQYVKLFPAKEAQKGAEERTQEVMKKLPSDLPITELGRKLFGLQKWNEKT